MTDFLNDLTGPRITAERTLRDRATFTRAGTGPGVLDYTTGILGRPADVIVDVGVPISVNAQDNDSDRSTVGDDDRLLDAYTARIPVRITGVAPGDLCTITFVHPRGDQALLGRTFVVRRAEVRTTIVLRHLTMTAVSSASGVPV